MRDCRYSTRSARRCACRLPFENNCCSGTYDDTQFLDMTPATASFTDGALLNGKTYTDSLHQYHDPGDRRDVSPLTVQVTAGGGCRRPRPRSRARPIRRRRARASRSPRPSPGPPTGTVTFKDGGTTIPATPSRSPGAGNTRTAPCTTSALAAACTASPPTTAATREQLVDSSPLSQTVKARDHDRVASSAQSVDLRRQRHVHRHRHGNAPTGNVAFTSDAASALPAAARSLERQPATAAPRRARRSALTARRTHRRELCGRLRQRRVDQRPAFAGGQQRRLSRPRARRSAARPIPRPPARASRSPPRSPAAPRPATSRSRATRWASRDARASASPAAATAAPRRARRARSRSARTRIVATYAGNGATRRPSARRCRRWSTAAAAAVLRRPRRVASSHNPSTSGASVTFTATVNGTAPTGNVGFTCDGATISGCARVRPRGSRQQPHRARARRVRSPSARTRSSRATAATPGTPPSTSAPLSQVVSAASTAPTETLLGSVNNPSPAGTCVTLVATVVASRRSSTAGSPSPRTAFRSRDAATCRSSRWASARTAHLQRVTSERRVQRARELQRRPGQPAVDELGVLASRLVRRHRQHPPVRLAPRIPSTKPQAPRRSR